MALRPTFHGNTSTPPRACGDARRRTVVGAVGPAPRAARTSPADTRSAKPVRKPDYRRTAGTPDRSRPSVTIARSTFRALRCRARTRAAARRRAPRGGREPRVLRRDLAPGHGVFLVPPTPNCPAPAAAYPPDAARPGPPAGSRQPPSSRPAQPATPSGPMVSRGAIAHVRPKPGPPGTSLDRGPAGSVPGERRSNGLPRPLAHVLVRIRA